MNKTPELVDLYTLEGEALTGTPWDSYPRPQLRREEWLNLNGEWDFMVSDGESFPTAYNRTIHVPFCPESLLSGIGEMPPKGRYLYYRRCFTLPKGFVKDRVLLHFGAVDQRAIVYINGSYVGEHTGGYHPFTLDITAYLEENNTVEVQVSDDLDSHVQPFGKQCRKRSGMWYTPVSGIWQTVWVESVPNDYVKGIAVTTDADGATLTVEGVTEGTVIVTTPDGDRHTTLSNGNARIMLKNPRFWCPADPYLYAFTLVSGEDSVSSYFALRTLTVETVDDLPRLCLNGKPYFFHAVLDQGYWSDGLFTPATPEAYQWDIQKMKELGFNTLRKHIKVEPARFYYDCDRLGMLVWQDMVNNGDYAFWRDTALPTVGFKRRNDRRLHRHPATRAAFEQAMEQTVAQLANHPCIVGWTIFNEGWGQFDSDRLYCKLKALDPTRFVDTASGWFAGADSDVVSHHVYFKPYRHKVADKPVVLSEFGGYSYKVSGHVFNLTDNYGYRTFRRQEDFQAALESLYREQIIPAVAKGLCGAVYTQLSDVEDETNGLVTYDRRVCKVSPAVMQAIAAELEIE